MREKINFNKDRYFHKGDIKPPRPVNYKSYDYVSAKAERYHMGPACKDYAIGGIPSEGNPLAGDYLKRDNAWYVKYFTPDESDHNRRIKRLFEGVATHATVYLNGCLMKRNFCGYTTFEVDITERDTSSPYAKCAQDASA